MYDVTICNMMYLKSVICTSQYCAVQYNTMLHSIAQQTKIKPTEEEKSSEGQKKVRIRTEIRREKSNLKIKQSRGSNHD